MIKNITQLIDVCEHELSDLDYSKQHHHVKGTFHLTPF